MTQDRAILLYGSHARGDADSASDVDVLVVGREAPSEPEISSLVPTTCRGPLHVSYYTWDEFSAMSGAGSLFLHHLVAEAQSLRYDGDAEARLSGLLRSVGPYQFAERDLCSFRATVRDVEDGLRSGLPPCFELAVLGGVARHASVLACYVTGRPVFGRNSIRHAAQSLGMGESRSELELAHRFRLFEEGQCSQPAAVSRAMVEHTVETLKAFLDRMEQVIHAAAA